VPPASPDKDGPDFYTVGYQGRDIGTFVAALTEAGIACLMDIRFNAVSMYKPAFSRRNLEAAVRAAGIDYLHMPYLGVPSDVRGRAVALGRPDHIWDWYATHVLSRYASNLHWFFNSSDHPVAMMCVERQPKDCHRHQLARALFRQGLRSLDL
jgi:uncharacterized protein (DUF488 family)